MISTSTNRQINYTGLKKRPQMEQFIDYLENGQERVKFPDREAKFIREHPFMTQLDFFDMQEEEKQAWEEQKRKQKVKEIATQTKTSEAIQSTKKRSRSDTVLPRPDGVSREEMQQAWTEDFENKRYYNETWEEHDAESRTMETMRNNKNESIAQTISFSLRHQTRHPDSDVFELPKVRPGGAKQNETGPVAMREDIPVQMGTKVQGDLPISVKADTAAKHGTVLYELGQWKKMLFGAPLSPKSQKEADAEYARTKEAEEWLKGQEEAARDKTIQGYLDEQASKQQKGFIDSFFDAIEGTKEEEKGDPSSSSAAAVQPAPKVKPSRDESGAVPKLQTSQTEHHFMSAKAARKAMRPQVQRPRRTAWWDESAKAGVA